VRMGKTLAPLAFALVAIVLAVTAFALARQGLVEHQSFKAFYCGGTAVRERQNPYLVEPLRSCERPLVDSDMPAGYVEPAPLPGYALLPFALLSVLPAKLASEVFAVLLVAAAVLGAGCLAPILRAPPAAVLLALAPLTLLNVSYGEIPPFALLALSASAYFFARDRWGAAGVAAALALIQPNVGLPAALAVVIFAPRCRVPVVLTAACLALISLAALGPAANLAYFTHVLPAMASAEIAAADQYSLAHLLYAAGVPVATASLVSKLWFGVLLIGGVALAGILARRLDSRTVLPLIPPATCLLFGLYLHDIQMLLALPAALLVASRLRSDAFAAPAAAAVALLAAVWTQREQRAAIVLDVVGVGGALYAVLSGSTVRRLAIAVLGAAATVAIALVLQRIEPPLTASQMVTHAFDAAPGDWAAIAWARYLEATPALTKAAFVLKLPTWAGLTALLVCAFRLCAVGTETGERVESAYASPMRMA